MACCGFQVRVCVGTYFRAFAPFIHRRVLQLFLACLMIPIPISDSSPCKPFSSWQEADQSTGFHPSSSSATTEPTTPPHAVSGGKPITPKRNESGGLNGSTQH